MIKYLDQGVRYTFGFAEGVMDRVHSANFFSEEAFQSYVEGKRRDWQMDPVEDFFIVKQYLSGVTTQDIAFGMNRSHRSVCLRLRVLLDIRNELFFIKPETESDGIQYIINGFYNRAIAFLKYCNHKIVDHLIMETFDVEDPYEKLVQQILEKKYF